MGETGIEPVLREEADFKSAASASSATRPWPGCYPRADALPSGGGCYLLTVATGLRRQRRPTTARRAISSVERRALLPVEQSQPGVAT